MGSLHQAVSGREADASKAPEGLRGFADVARRALFSRDVDDLHPVRAIADRVAAGLTQLPRALVDLVDRQAVRFFTS
jgi:hypothetical protein